jgi:hypothetical protein
MIQTGPCTFTEEEFFTPGGDLDPSVSLYRLESNLGILLSLGQASPFEVATNIPTMKIQHNHSLDNQPKGIHWVISAVSMKHIDPERMLE